MPAKNEDLPSTLDHPPDELRHAYEKTLDGAHGRYGDEERVQRTAWAVGEAR